MIGPLYDEVDRSDDELGLPSPPATARLEPGARLASPAIRSRLHVICALYAHTPQPERRLALLDHLERMTLEAAESLATHLLASGWRPRTSEETSEAA